MKNRRFISTIVIFLLAFLMIGCSKKNVQEDLLNYINNDLSKLATLESKTINDYSGVTGANFENDFKLYQVITDNIVPNYRIFVDKLEKVTPKTPQVKELHQIYVSGANLQYDAFVQIKTALEKQDVALVTKANEKLAEARKKILEFQSKLQSLAEKHNIILEGN